MSQTFSSWPRQNSVPTRGISWWNFCFLFLLTFPVHAGDLNSDLGEIPDHPALHSADSKYLALFEVSGDDPIGAAIRDPEAARLGLAGWKRIVSIFPQNFRTELIQFNVQEGQRWAGVFDGDGKNDLGRPGYRLSVAKYLLEEENELGLADRPLSPRRGTLDWTLVHEMGHYICLQHDLIELFSQSFDGDEFEQPQRRDDPQNYPEDGSPLTEGNFVTSYAERNPGDEETVETLTTFFLIDTLPENDSLAAKKIRFFTKFPAMEELRQHIQRKREGWMKVDR